MRRHHAGQCRRIAVHSLRCITSPPGMSLPIRPVGVNTAFVLPVRLIRSCIKFAWLLLWLKAVGVYIYSAVAVHMRTLHRPQQPQIHPCTSLCYHRTDTVRVRAWIYFSRQFDRCA